MNILDRLNNSKWLGIALMFPLILYGIVLSIIPLTLLYLDWFVEPIPWDTIVEFEAWIIIVGFISLFTKTVLYTAMATIGWQIYKERRCKK